MPRRRLLVGVGDAQQAGLVERPAGQLQADRQAIRREPARHADRRQAGQVGADREHVGQIHLQRIVGALAEPERRRRTRRHRDRVHVGGERDVVVAADQRPHLLRLQVVGLVVARAQHVGAEHDAALHLGAEVLAAGAVVERRQIVARRELRARRVADAVVAGQVRAGLGGRHQVVDRDGRRRVRQRHVDERRAEPLEHDRARRRSPSGPRHRRPSRAGRAARRCGGRRAACSTPRCRPRARARTGRARRRAPSWRRPCRGRPSPRRRRRRPARSARTGRSDRATSRRRAGRSARRGRRSA